MEPVPNLNKDLLDAEVMWGGKEIPRIVLEPADVALANECARIIYDWWTKKPERFKSRCSWSNTVEGYASGKMSEFAVAKWMADCGVISDYLGWLTKVYNTIKKNPGSAFEEPSDITAKVPCFDREVRIDIKSWKYKWWRNPASAGVLSVDQIRRHTGKIDLYIATRPYIDRVVLETRESKAQEVVIDVMFWTSLYHINRWMAPWYDLRVADQFGKAAPHCVTPSRIWYPMDKLLEPLNKPLPVYKWVNGPVIQACVDGWEKVNGKEWIGR